jgi:hypothetical protein
MILLSQAEEHNLIVTALYHDSHLFECVHTRTRVSGCSKSCLMAWANVYVLPVPNGPTEKRKGDK